MISWIILIAHLGRQKVPASSSYYHQTFAMYATRLRADTSNSAYLNAKQLVAHGKKESLSVSGWEQALASET